MRRSVVVALMASLGFVVACPSTRGGGGDDDDDDDDDDSAQDPDAGNGTDDSEALREYLDSVPEPFCDWLVDCGMEEAERTECEQEIEEELADLTLCDDLVDYWVDNHGDLEACLEDPGTDCGEDFSRFCPAADDVDWEEICAPAPECVLPGDCDDGETCVDEVCVPEDSDCIETTFVVTNGAGLEGDLYTGTSWELDDCTEIQPDPWTVTIRCPVGCFGQTDLMVMGCSILGVAAPGNILSDEGAAPPAGYDECSGQTVRNTTITCYQECRDLYELEITSGPCS